MVDGTYMIEIDTPLGRQPGSMILSTEGDVVHADIDAPVIGKQKTKGKLEGNTFTAEGTFKMLLIGKIEYILRCEFSGDDVRVTIKSSKGDFEFTGARV